MRKENFQKEKMFFKYIKVLVIVALIFAPWITKAQSNNIEKSFRNEQLTTVLKQLEQETGYRFSYSSTAIPTDMKITVSLQNASVEEALARIFDNTPITYEIIDKRIILKQNKVNQTVRGRVIDRQTQTPITGAAVVLVGTNPLKGDATDSEGYFRIPNVATGRHTVKASFLGYRDELLPDVLVGSGKEVVLVIEMSESLLEMQEISVDAGIRPSVSLNEMAQVSGRSFTVEETKRFPVSVGDPLRLASSFAGVVATDDGDNEIIIRGNSPRGLLWLLEGVEIPSPNHFSSEGASTGAISMFSTQVITRSDFLTSAFPAEYGNATSGVFDIGLRKGNDEHRESTFQFGLLGLDIASEGPFTTKNSGSYLFNYRYSTLSLLSAVGLPLEEDGERNVFQDLSFKMNLPTEKMGTFSLFGLGGLSKFKEDFPDRKNEESYNMGVVGLSNIYIINNSMVLTNTLSWSGTRVQDDYEVPRLNSYYKENNLFKKNYLRASTELSKKFNAHHFVTTGVTASRFNYDFKSSEQNPANQAPYKHMQLLDDEGHSGSFQSFASWKWRPDERLTLVNGVHVLHFFLTRETVIEPRSNIRWQFTPTVGLFAGFGMHSRIESLEYYFANYINADGSKVDHNGDLGVTRANHWVLGFDWNLTDRTYLKTELYYQYLHQVPVLADTSIKVPFSTINVSDGYVSESLVNGGSGTNYGIEVTIERKFNNSYYFLVSGMLYESKYKARDGITRNTRYNGNFGYNILAGKEFVLGRENKHRVLGVNIKVSHAGNKRYTPIDLEKSREYGTEFRRINDAYTKKYRDYFRTDLQVSLRKNIKDRTVEWRLDIQNLTNYTNELGVYYDAATESIKIERETVFIPVLSYRIEF